MLCEARACGGSPGKPLRAPEVLAKEDDDMASYHLSATIIGRSDGRSAIAAAAYRSGSTLADPETGQVHDYTRKSGVVGAFIVAPESAPEWATDRAALWPAVHAKETRKNSQLARELTMALPNELPPDEAEALVRAWVANECVSRGMIADVAIHDPRPRPGQPRNRHAHVMLTMRSLDAATADGWAKGKAREWNTPETLEGWRASWAEAQNAALDRAGAIDRVDHRSLPEQRRAAIDTGDDVLAEALDRPPEPRLGVVAGNIDRKAGEPVTDRGMALAEARKGRAALLDALDRARAAARTIGAAMRQATRPVSDLTASLFARPAKEPAAAPSRPEPKNRTTFDDDDSTPEPA